MSNMNVNETAAYKIAITSVIEDSTITPDCKTEALKVLYRALNWAERRELNDSEHPMNEKVILDVLAHSGGFIE